MARKTKADLPPNTSTDKATHAEVEQRIQAVVAMVLDGYSRSDIAEYALKKWNISPATVDDIYLPRAKERIAERSKTVLESKFDIVLEMAFRLYKTAMAQGNLRVANSTLQEINRMLGNHAPNRSELTGKDGAPIQLEDTKQPDFSGWTVEQLLAWRRMANDEPDNG